MGSTRTQVGDFGIWIHLAGHLTKAEAQRTKSESEEVLDGFEGGFCIIVDRRHLETVEEGAIAVFQNLIAESAPSGLQRLAVVYDGQLLRPHIAPEELPPRFRNVFHYIDASRAKDWKREAIRWVQSGSRAPEQVG